MEKCFVKTHSVVQLLFVLWMASLIHIAVGNFFICSGSNMSVSVTLVCNGYYNCDNYEDESSCDYSATYLQEGESHIISLPHTNRRRLYDATLIQTNATNGFQVVFHDLFIFFDDDLVQIGTGNDPSDIQSIVATIHGFENNADDIYVNSNEMWFAAIGGLQSSSIRMDVGVTAIDLLNYFPCSGSNMNVLVTLVCDGYYDCDNYVDESTCNYSSTYLPEGESHIISLSYTTARRLYNATLIQTNATNGFLVVFQDLYLPGGDQLVQIGTGDDPSDIQSVITTIHGYNNNAEDHVYVRSTEMWFAVIGELRSNYISMDVNVTAIDSLNDLFPCSGSNFSVLVMSVCDGYYNCDNYEDESSCNYSATYLQAGESHIISFLLYTDKTRLYDATLIQTNATNGFQVVFQDLYLRRNGDLVQIGTGNDPSDIQSVITTIRGYKHTADDILVGSNEMWFAVIGGIQSSSIRMDVRVTAIDLLNFFPCSGSNMNVSVTLVCDGYYNCDNYEDESSCNSSAIYLQAGESRIISLPLHTDITRLYNATLIQTNATNGFQVVFQDLYLPNNDDLVQIGTGNDPSDIQSVITSIPGYISYYADDVQVNSNEMWFAAIGGLQDGGMRIRVGVTAIDLRSYFPCSRSNMSVLVTLVCDGYYNCDNYEDESSCNYSAIYLQEGESHIISLPNATTRSYDPTLLQTNATNGFQVVFQHLYVPRNDDLVQIGTGNDPSDRQSVITTINGRKSPPDDMYVDSNEMWFVSIRGLQWGGIRMDVRITSIDSLNLFPCSGANMNVSVTLVCDGYYNCDNYEDESSCNYSATYLQEGESHIISLLYLSSNRLYNETLIRTNDTNGFQVVFQDLNLAYGDLVQIGTGNDPSDIQSVITTIHGFKNYADDIYVHSNEMWFAVIGGVQSSRIRMDVSVTAIDLLNIFPCSGSNMNVSMTLVCDGYYNCDNYEDESSCNYSATYLQEGESYIFSLPYTTTRGLYNATFIQTNATNGFQVVFRDLYLPISLDLVQIGTGNDPSDIQSVITTIHGYTNNSDDIYVHSNEMWFAAIGGLLYRGIRMDVRVTAIDLLNYPAIWLEEGESHNISLPYTATTLFFNVTLIQTNATNGFQVVFRDLFLPGNDDLVQIGTGNDPSDIQSVITTIHGTRSYVDDAYVHSNEMWFAVIGGVQFSSIRMDVGVTAIDLLNFFPCSGSNMSVSVTLVCDGYYNCDNYEDESSCNYSAKYLQEGESHIISSPYNKRIRWYNATLLQTNAKNGFQVAFQYLYLSRDAGLFQIGTGNDPSDMQSVIATIKGYKYYADDIYVDSNEMWFAVIGGLQDGGMGVRAGVTAIDLLNYFPCLGLNSYVLVTLVCDGHYDCGDYADESSCSYSAPYLQEGESHNISLPYTNRRRFYNATLIQTNATNGFLVVFKDFLLSSSSDLVQIGTGNDPSDKQSVITTIRGFKHYADDIYVDSNEMWIAAIGAWQNSGIRMNVGVTAIDLLNFFPCSESNMNVLVTMVCDGYYNCDNYEDESSCNYSARYLQEGESHIISIPLITTRRFYNATLIQTNATNGFRVVFHDLLLDVGNEIQIGTGNDSSDVQSVITTIGYRNYPPDDVYVDTNEMWFAVIGAKRYPFLRVDVQIISIDLSENACLSTPCLNGGTCQPTEIGYQCICMDPFIGRNCEIENACLSTPCLNGGTCQPTEIGYQCICMDPFIGRNCEIGYVDPCTQHDPCVYGECRHIGQGRYECECQDHYDGIHCDEPTPICQNISWISPRFGRVQFPVGENGTWANSTGMCPFNTSQANEPIGRALCIGDGITHTQWLPVDNCGPFRNVTDILTEMAQVIVSEENADEVSQQVSSVTSNIEDITSDDIMFVAEITSNIVQQNLTSEKVTESITSIASNIAQVETEELEAAEIEGGAISKFVQAFEEQISRVEVADGGMLNIQQPNVAVQVKSVLLDDLMRGLVLSLAGSSLSDLTKSNITIDAPTKDDHNDVIATRPDIIAQVNIPPSISSVISSTTVLSNGSGEYVRVNFNVFSNPALFISKSLRTISADNEGFNRSANSPVISLSIGQGKIAALTEFINFTFSTLKSGYVNPMCSFWDEEEEDWSQDGCVLVSGFASSDERYDEEGVRCACDHLTNFAVIMETHRQEDSLIEANNVLTYIGCCISIFSLLVTLATYLWNKDLRTKQPNQIFICLCLNLLCLYTTFVIMISQDSIRDYREVQAGPCGFLAALVHFFVLSSISWMGVEGYNTYIIIAKIVNTYIQNFMIKASLAAWGIPAVIVVLTGAIARGSYAHDDICFLQFWAQIGGLLIPMCIILLINIVIFILVVRKLLQSANIAGRVEREATVECRETIERVQNAICILLLLSLTWVTGYLLLIPLFSQVAQLIFVVLNSFQGFFIFLLYCVRKPDIRKKLRLTCFDKLLKKEASTSSGVPTKDNNPDPMCVFNPTYDASQVEEGVTPPTNKDIQSSTEEQKKDTDRDATGTDVGTVGLPLDASVTKATKRRDDVSSTTDDETLSATVDSTNVRKASEGTDDVASTNNDAAVSLPKDAADGTIHNERSDDHASASSDTAANLPIDSTDVSKGD